MKKISFGKIAFVAHDTDKQLADQSAASGFGAINRSESCGASSSSRDVSSADQPQEDNVAAVMGFGEFGGKKAQQFDVESLVQQSLQRLKTSTAKHDVEPGEDDSGDSQSEDSTSRQSDDEESDEQFIGPPVPKSGQRSPQTSDSTDDVEARSEDELSEDSDEEVTDACVPDACHIALTHGDRPVTALTVDAAGARLITGCVGHTVKYWDFSGMTCGLRYFKECQPFGSYPVNDVQYSASGDRAVLVSGSARVVIVDRDGGEVARTTAGDMYLTDMARTKGHVGAVHAASWQPHQRHRFATCSADGTVRIWSVDEAAQRHTHLIKPRAVGGLKAVPSTCRHSRDGHLIAAACTDGSIQMWDQRKHFVNTCLLTRGAHTRGTETSSLVFSYDGTCVATRGGDDTLKLWDMRQMARPLHTAAGLFNKFISTDCVFSPNDRMLATGTSLERGETTGKLHVFSRLDFSTVKQVDVPNGHVVRVVWHPRINQLLLGCGDGSCRVLYDPSKSQRGALLCATKRRTKTKQMEVMTNTTVITPHALPMFREKRQKSLHRTMEKARKDPVKSRRPDLPQGKSGTGGRVAPGGSTLSSYVMRTLGKEAKQREEGDPREALLKHAQEAAENPYWVAPAYARTQPKPIFQSPPAENDEPQQKKPRT